jgi:hypothetical protein
MEKRAYGIELLSRLRLEQGDLLVSFPLLTCPSHLDDRIR